jgi:hypothetical protein
VSSRHSWVLAALAVVLAVPIVAMAWFMLVPVAWDGGGRLGCSGLAFPLHLLVDHGRKRAAAAVSWWASAPLAGGGVPRHCVLAARWRCGPVRPTAPGRGDRSPVCRSVPYVRSAAAPTGGAARHRDGRVRAGPPHGRVAPGRRRAGSPTGRRAACTAAVGWPAAGARCRRGRPWLNDRGYGVFDIEYRLAPPAAMARGGGAMSRRQCRGSRTTIGAYDVDPGRITLMGHSAGGHLALLAAYGDAVRRPDRGQRLRARAISTRCSRRSGSRQLHRPLPARRFVGGAPTMCPTGIALRRPSHHVTAPHPDHHGARPARPHHARGPGRTCSMPHWRRPGGPRDGDAPATDHGFDLNWGGFGTQLARAAHRPFPR